MEEKLVDEFFKTISRLETREFKSGLFDTIIFMRNNNIYMIYLLDKETNESKLTITKGLYEKSKLRYISFHQGKGKEIFSKKFNEIYGLDVKPENISVGNTEDETKSSIQGMFSGYKPKPKPKKSFFNRLTSYFKD